MKRAAFTVLGCTIAAAVMANSWRTQPFSDASLVADTLIGKVRVTLSVTSSPPLRIARLALEVNGRSLKVPADIYRGIINPRVQETLVFVPFQCSTADCSDGPVAIQIRFYPHLGDTAPSTDSTCESSLLKIVFDRTGIEEASVLDCAGTERERERTIFARSQ
jgi:hypothetical protein